MKQCPQCQRVYGHEALYCLEDGTPLTDARDPAQDSIKTVYLSTPPASDTTAPKKKLHPAIWAVGFLGIAALLVVIGMSIARNKSSDSASLLSDAGAIVPENIYLEKEQYKFFPFSTGPGGAQVVGQFSARGGVGNDVRIIILTSAEFENYKNKYPYKKLYDEEVNFGEVGEINLTLPLGSYYIIVDNPSPWTDRRVRASIHLKDIS